MKKTLEELRREVEETLNNKDTLCEDYNNSAAEIADNDDFDWFEWGVENDPNFAKHIVKNHN